MANQKKKENSAPAGTPQRARTEARRKLRQDDNLCHRRRLMRRTAERLDGLRTDAALRKLQARARIRNYNALPRKQQAELLSPTAAGDRQFSERDTKHFKAHAPARLKGAS